MFKKFIAIALIALVTASATTACGDNSADNMSASEAEEARNLPAPFGNCQATRKDSEVRLEDYVTPCISDGKIRWYDFSLQFYLNDYGVLQIQLFNNDEQDIRLATRFGNGVIVGMSFRHQPDVPENAYELTEVVVTAGKPDYRFTTYEALKDTSKSRNKKLARWSRVFNYYDMVGVVDERYILRGDLCGKYYPFHVDYHNQAFYFFNNKSLFLPLDFDYNFRKTIVPYLDIKKISLKKDPFNDKKFE